MAWFSHGQGTRSAEHALLKTVHCVTIVWIIWLEWTRLALDFDVRLAPCRLLKSVRLAADCEAGLVSICNQAVMGMHVIRTFSN
jgi:hypothetical protein